ncbi:PREDICTED: peroxisomal 2,4-dienoyl-CoA reductase-like isoform X2 [Camelina sativa]|uniref:Peroxisomal 2,4-dienoyl-CoA reductase-like isoform X2 n=1 Tax=Camelina sativa TaxID=90675 RepID=A0ABM0TPE9_CAMSA|nr:PREDICTED: peroxisomal 2,4-dienoyl-CoA reductase-like isoform X2 [Camelina sativa]
MFIVMMYFLISGLVLDIDAVGTFNMCHAALKYLKKDGPGRDSSTRGGSIINISATLHYTASWYQIHVSAAKINGCKFTDDGSVHQEHEAYLVNLIGSEGIIHGKSYVIVLIICNQ